MDARELRNMIKAIAILLVETVLVIGVLWGLSTSYGAGDDNFHIGMVFVLIQSIVIIICYVCWYLAANRRAADLVNIEEMRKEAFNKIPLYLIVSILITGGVAGIVVVCIISKLIFVEINDVYCYSTALMEFFVGNITLYLTMRFWGIPDRVLGRY